MATTVRCEADRTGRQISRKSYWNEYQRLRSSSRASSVFVGVYLMVAPATSDAADLFSPRLSGIQHTEVDISASASTLATRYAGFDLTVAPFSSIYETGFQLHLSTAGVGYNYVASQDPWTLASGRAFEGSVLAGYQIATERLNVVAMLGVTLSASEDQGVARTQNGATGTLAISATPTKKTIVSLSGLYSNISNTYQLQARLGLKDPGNFYFGPEVSIAGTTPFVQGVPISQEQVGVYVSGISISGSTWLSLSGGFVNQQQLGGGGYLSVGLSVAF